MTARDTVIRPNLRTREGAPIEVIWIEGACNGLTRPQRWTADGKHIGDDQNALADSRLDLTRPHILTRAFQRVFGERR